MNKEDLNKTLDYNYLINNIKKIKRKNKKSIIFRIIPELLIPILIVLSVISTHSNDLIFKPLNYIIYALLFIFLLIFIIGLFKYRKIVIDKTSIIFKVLIVLYILGCTFGLLLLYSPNSKFKDWYISTGMATKNHQYLCKWLYSSNEIDNVMNQNYIIEVNEETDTSLVEFDKEEVYENEYDEQILKHDKDAIYKIIELEVNGQKAYLAAIYDASKVKVAITSRLGVYGQLVTKMAENNNAVLAVNGGGFYDPGNSSTGGMPTGITIKDGKIITNNTYSSYTQSGGIIGLTNDNKLVLMKTGAQKAIEAGVRDAVSWGPFLIVNGKKAFMRGNGGWGYAARTAIGQRSDGIILLLVVNSNATRTKGADMVDLAEIMENYGAINAANLDGGTSTVMVLPQKEALKYTKTCNSTYCYINDPIDSTLAHKTRSIATSIIVTE